MKFRKLVSFGVVSAMVSAMASSAFAVVDVTGTTGNTFAALKPFVISGDSSTLKGVSPTELETKIVNGYSYNGIHLKGSNTDVYKIYFGISNDTLFGTGSSSTKPKNQNVILAASSNGIKKDNSGEFTNRGVDISTNRQKVTTKTGEYAYACCVSVTFKNTSSNDQYGAYDITLKGAKGDERVFKLTTTSYGMDSSDVSKADVEVTEDGYRSYADDTKLRNGAVITVAELKEMVGKGNYKFTGISGVNLLSSVSQATVNEGRAVYSVTLGTDTALEARYNAEGTGKVLKLSVPFFKNENRKVNIDVDDQKVIDLLGTDIADKIVNGSVKRLYVYPINASGYETLANASGNDGVINTDEVISATVSDSKIVFEMKKGITDVMISLKEIDTAKLPAVAGVSIPETTSDAANEIVAPIISDEATSDVVASIVSAPVVEAPVMTQEPATTNAKPQNTGANDVVVLAIALATMSMAAAGVVASKKF